MRLDEIEDPEEIEIATRTSRSKGAIGPKAKVPRYVRNYITKDSRILDFGSGKEAMHANDLKSEGYNVYAHELGPNFDPEYHNKNALDQQYDLVYASNVLNVQPSENALRNTLSQINSVLVPGGQFIGNYPKEPRKPGVTPKELKNILGEYFTEINVLEKGNSPVFLAVK